MKTYEIPEIEVVEITDEVSNTIPEGVSVEEV